eukprot:scaffold37190_cov264-Isochrysis_galbana.AAC.1
MRGPPCLFDLEPGRPGRALLFDMLRPWPVPANSVPTATTGVGVPLRGSACGQRGDDASDGRRHLERAEPSPGVVGRVSTPYPPRLPAAQAVAPAGAGPRRRDASGLRQHRQPL